MLYDPHIFAVMDMGEIHPPIHGGGYQVLGVEQVSVNAKEGGNDYCIYLGVEQVYYT